MIANRNVTLNKSIFNKGTVLYWMSRDQRAKDNWALNYAIDVAKENKSNLVVVFTLVDEFLGASVRQFGFLLRGIVELKERLSELRIPLKLLQGEPSISLSEYSKKINAGIIICDFDPLKIKRKWKYDLLKLVDIPVVEVDTHNIVPCRTVSKKQEFAAYTIRPSIRRLINDYLIEIPSLTKFEYNSSLFIDENNSELNFDLSKYNQHPKEVDWIIPGERSAELMMREFIENRLENYHVRRNNPSVNGCSNLSPYLHFGQISAQRVALEIIKSDSNPLSKESFLEELIVRKELSDNYCFFCNDYDNFDGFPNWAKYTLNAHRNDHREVTYSLKELENSLTHDDEWNKAQNEMVMHGKMHGYRRMYWAKKIFEWSHSPEEAQKSAIYLNDKYELDGRDPNGYVGIAWSIGGVHDRAWGERPIFGKVRYMALSGIKKKYRL